MTDSYADEQTELDATPIDAAEAETEDTTYESLNFGHLDIPTNRNLTPWTAQDYNPLVTGSGAIKLSKSGIAPLVAAARGFESVVESQAKDFAKRRGIPDSRSKKGQQFLQSFRDDGDALVMPWYSVERQVKFQEDLEASAPTSLQLRPQNPRTNDAGKLVKYEFLIGDDTVLDYHPALTREWTTNSARTLIAEGLLKGDSALTAMLRSTAGISDEDLALTDSDITKRINAIHRLHELLQRVPVENRTAIMSVAGVGNWRNNPEWFTVNLRERDVLIAFDGDVATNWNVWNQAKQMFDFIEMKKRGEPRLLSIGHSTRYLTALADDPHMGIDDFFHHVGMWEDLEDMIMPELPTKPSRDEATQEGLWRVTTDGTSVEALIMKDERLQWVHQIGIGGRIKEFVTTRAATAEERSGEPFGTGVRESDNPMTVTIEVAWMDDRSGEKRVAEVTGPANLLNYPPKEWVRHGAFIPPSLLAHREWPPRKGDDWMSAIKDHDREDQTHQTRWGTMGWVPVPGEEAQAFIVGDQVLAANKHATEATLPGVSEDVLPSADKFGVHDVYTDPGFIDPKGKFDLRDDIRELFEVYIEHSPWKTLEAAATVLAAALRPTVPLTSNSTCYFVGAPQKGKSWTAEQMMSFYQRKPGGWDALPGSASDTFASTENAISKTPIWVADDLAPTNDINQARSQMSAVGQLIRSVFNRTNKRRMNSDMTAKATPPPMALFVLTAEVEHAIPSIRQRVAAIYFNGLADGRWERADQLAQSSTVASRITAAIIRMFIEDGATNTWADLVSQLESDYEINRGLAKSALTTGRNALPESGATRPSQIVADLSLGLAALEQLCRLLGMDDYADKLTWEDGGLAALLAEQIKIGNQGRDQETPGRQLIAAIRQLLASGLAHVANADNPGAPPIADDADAARINALLGWRPNGQDVRPQGPTIGFYTWVKPRDAKEPVEVLVMSRDEAFNLARRHYPDLILHGASQNTSWTNAWELNLIHPAYADKKPAAGVVKQFRVGAGESNRGRIDGIPLSMDVLFGGDLAADHD